jgi:RNA polymerase sigma-70 factor (ECF subfamily)
VAAAPTVPIALAARTVYITASVIDRAEVQRLMVAASDGERASLEPLFALLWPVTVAYATKLVGEASLAEDCAQDAIVKLFAQLDRFDRERDGLTWALTLATWQCRTARRTRERRREDSVSADGAHDARVALEERELVRAAVSTLESLPERDREIITASLTDDDELRRTLAPATFRKRLERALGRLRTSWRSRHGTL